MKPLTPHDPLDDLIAAALHGDLSPEERAQFESRLTTDPAARAAYQEAQAMHDLLEKTHKNAQPDPAFEQRMVSGVRRKLQTEQHRETAWESAVYFWKWTKNLLLLKWKRSHFAVGSCLAVVALALGYAVYHDVGVLRGLGDNGIANPSSASIKPRFFLPSELYVAALEPSLEQAKKEQALTAENADMQAQLMEPSQPVQNFVSAKAARDTDLKRQLDQQGVSYTTTSSTSGVTVSGYVAAEKAPQSNVGGSEPFNGANTYTGGTTVTAGGLAVSNGQTTNYAEPDVTTTPQGGTVRGQGFAAPMNGPAADNDSPPPPTTTTMAPTAPATAWDSHGAKIAKELAINDGEHKSSAVADFHGMPASPDATVDANAPATSVTTPPPSSPPAFFGVPLNRDDNGHLVTDGFKAAPSAKPGSTMPTAAPAPAVDTRKLIRNAQLDLEVKSFQAAIDQITALTKGAGGYVDTSNSQKGGNGKLQGTVVVKVMPQNLDTFLLKLRDLGEVQNQSVSTDDVTKDYFDTQARLVNSQKMEVQLQDLLKRENGKVADLLAVERELGRVRGEIEGMQGQLKLYDFQVEYATVTMNLSEKDLNQAAAYLLKEQDDFSLFATDVEATFQKARQSADSFKAQVLTANLNHNSGSDVSAELVVMVAPDQIEPFLSEVRGLGRVANFTRQTQRVAKDGGDSSQPADETRTEKDKVQVHLAIRSDDETRKQVALTVVAKAVDVALDQAKTAALANAGVEILSSSLNKTPQGASTAQLTVRVPGSEYSTLIAAFNALGRAASLSIQRNDNSGPGANGDDAPVIVSLSLTDDDQPLQETQLSVVAPDVDAQSQQIKKAAGDAGVEVKASSFERQPDGTEVAQMTFRLPMAKYASFVASVQGLGKVESLTVHRDDRPDQTRTDDSAPAEISLTLHNQRGIVADDGGLWVTLRQTFGEGLGALFGSIRVIGVIIAFLAPWVVTIILLAWVGRRIYIWRKMK